MIPQNLQGILWNVSVDKLDKQGDKNYIIHQILAYGNLDHIRWLYQNYSKAEIIQTFSTFPAKNYTPAAFNFVKNIILELGDSPADERRYVKTFPRFLG